MEDLARLVLAVAIEAAFPSHSFVQSPVIALTTAPAKQSSFADPSGPPLH
jgi:hypothetical protein